MEISQLNTKDAFTDIKVCKTCDEPKPITLFSSRSHTLKDGSKVRYISPYCNTCKSKENMRIQRRSEEIIQRNKEYQKEYHKNYVRKSKKEVILK